MRARMKLTLAIMAAAALGLAAVAQANQNDNINAAVALTLNVFDETTNIGSTVQPGEPLTPPSNSWCPENDIQRYAGATLWYFVTGNGKQIDVSTEGSAIDTVMAVYKTATSPSVANVIKCSDDSAGDLFSRVSFQSLAGAGYLIQVGGRQLCPADVAPCFNGAGVQPAAPPTGTIRVIARFTPPPPVPPPPVVVRPPPPEVIRPATSLSPKPYFRRSRGRIVYLGIKVGKLVVRQLPTGTRVQVGCTRGACPAQVRTAGENGRVEFPRMRNRKMRRGRQIVISATKPGAIGSYIRYFIGRNRAAKVELCLKPGDKQPQMKC